MIIKNQKIELKWTPKNKQYFESKGYTFTNKYDIFLVSIFDLEINSNKKIDCICDYCGSNFKGRFSSFSQYLYKENYKIACNKCTSKKIKDTNLEKYGVKVPIQNDIIKEKIKNTCLQKYGVEYSGQSCQKKQKTKQTNLKRYGVEYNLQIPEIRKQIKETCLKKYGVDNPLKCKSIKQKMIDTNLKRYSVRYTFEAEDIKRKIKQTHFKNYGVNYTMQREDIKIKLRSDSVRHKMNKTIHINGNGPCSKQQKYLHDLLGGELNYPIGRCMLDIAFPDEMIYIEYDGGGHDLCIKFGQVTKNEFDLKEIRRERYLRNKGWKIIRIVSPRDKLLSDDIIMELIKNSKQYLLNSDHTWINIDFENMSIKCSEYNKIIDF